MHKTKAIFAFVALLAITATAQINNGGGGGGGSGTATQGVAPFNGVCNGAMPSATTVSGTDDTAALNTQLTAAMASNSTTHTIVFPAGKMCLFNSAAITLPNNGDSFPDGAGTISSQNPLRLTCSSAGGHAQLLSSGATINQVQSGCVLLMTFNAGSGNAKLISLGMGQLEIDHLSFITNNTSDVSDFLLTTNTSVNIHDNMFVGQQKAVTATTYSVNDAIRLGGNATATPGMTVTSPFQGYPATIERNWFNQVRRALFCGTFCNGVHFNNNTIWSEGGFATGGVIEINCGANCNPPPQGNFFIGNIIEISHYLFGYNFSNGVTVTTVEGGGCFDPVELSPTCVNAGATATQINLHNVYSGAHNMGAANVTTSGWTSDTDWARSSSTMVMRTDDFLLLSKSGHYKTSATGGDTTTDTAPSCTQVAGTCTFTFNQSWSSAPRCTGTWNGTGTFTGILKVIPTTTNVACTSTVGTDTAVCNMICVGAPR